DDRACVVAADGTGRFRTVQAAIDAAPANSASPLTIRIRPGKYAEQVTVPREKLHVALVGEDAARTVLTYSLNAHSPAPGGGALGTFKSASTFVFGDDFSAENLTFENAS